MKTLNMNTRKEPSIEINIENVEQVANYTWFRGDHCNYNPHSNNMKSCDSVLKFVLQGWRPDKPYIGPQTNVTAFGSCFAANISKWLSKRNFNVLTDKNQQYGDTYVARFGEGMVNTYAIRQQFEWAFEGIVCNEELWHGYDAKAFGYDEKIRLQTREIFEKTDIFIITLGLSEVWYDSKTGGVFWRAVPREKFDASRHKFRVTSFDENKDNLYAIYNLIRKHREHTPIIFTLSPVPLVATFRPISCITANSVSKAILRAALDSFLTQHESDNSLYYWPSYEIITSVFPTPWEDDRRHVKEPVLDFIMTLFEDQWCFGSSPPTTIEEAWSNACAVGGIQLST